MEYSVYVRLAKRHYKSDTTWFVGSQTRGSYANLLVDNVAPGMEPQSEVAYHTNASKAHGIFRGF